MTIENYIHLFMLKSHWDQVFPNSISTLIYLEFLHLRLLFFQCVFEFMALDLVLHLLEPLGTLFKLVFKVSPLGHSLVKGLFSTSHLVSIVLPLPANMFHFSAKNILSLRWGVFASLCRQITHQLQFAISLCKTVAEFLVRYKWQIIKSFQKRNY